ncbi:MAG: adenylyl-sulfate kinase, partial [Methylocella sp.]
VPELRMKAGREHRVPLSDEAVAGLDAMPRFSPRVFPIGNMGLPMLLRRMVRELLDRHEFIEIFVATPLEECIARDPKGLYKKAMAGEIKNFTGIDQSYEPQEAPEVIVGRDNQTAAQAAAQIVALLTTRGLIDRIDDLAADWSI